MNLAFRAGCDLKCFPHYSCQVKGVITSTPGWGSKTHININKSLKKFFLSQSYKPMYIKTCGEKLTMTPKKHFDKKHPITA